VVKAFCIKAQDKANFGSSSSRNGEAAAAHLRPQANVAISMAAQNLCSSGFARSIVELRRCAVKPSW
jgi:hypothetical protein